MTCSIYTSTKKPNVIINNTNSPKIAVPSSVLDTMKGVGENEKIYIEMWYAKCPPGFTHDVKLEVIKYVW